MVNSQAIQIEIFYLIKDSNKNEKEPDFVSFIDIDMKNHRSKTKSQTSDEF